MLWLAATLSANVRSNVRLEGVLVSDGDLRLLERAALASGTDEDAAALLLGRLRAGSLTASLLELAAYCGHKPAVTVLTHDDMHPCGCWRPRGTCPPCIHSDLDSWCQALFRWPASVTLRAAAIACRTARHNWMVQDELHAIEAAEAWLACPCDAHVPKHLPTEFPSLENHGASRPVYRLVCCISSAQNNWNVYANGAGDAIRGCIIGTATEALLRSTVHAGLAKWALA